MLLRKNNKPFYHFLAGIVVVSFLMYNIYPFFAGMEALRPYVSLLVGVFGIPAFLISLLLSHALEIIIGQSTIPGVSPMLPGVSDGGLVFFFPGTGIEIDFWQALIAIIALLVPHEFAHGVMSRCQGIKVRSAGILSAGPVPIGAFVEPDERAMKKHTGRERMRIFAAGSFTNLIVSAIALILFISMTPLVSTMSEPAGMMITNVVDGTPASDMLERGFVITEIDGTETSDMISFLTVLKDVKPDQTLKFVTSNGTFVITLDEHPENSSRGYIGIDLRETYDRKDEFKNEYRLYADAVLFTLPTLFWIFFLCFNIALVNLLPIVPFDGGKMFEEYMAEFRIKKKRKEQIQKLVIFIILALLLVNALPLINVIMP
jgi:membrane-associated protease RseP (regulator of RpoE activity)